jgi:Helix-turn-helix domain
MTAYATQAEKVLAYLSKGNTLTAKQAMSRFKIQKLSARIFELKEEGHNIVATPLPHAGVGAPRVKYSLAPKSRKRSTKA